MNIQKKNLPHPLLKWVGGKQKIIENIINRFPNEMNNYHEPFIGGGSVLLALLWAKNNKLIKIHNDIFAYDLNESLIHTYNNIRKVPKELHECITPIIKEYHNIKTEKGNQKPETYNEALSSKESYYYWTRKCFNKQEDKSSLISSAYFIFLNKIGFKGMYREGPNGMNIPFGHYFNINFELDKLLEISQLIQPVRFIHSDFSDSLSKVNTNDFIYLDPPYAPEDNKSFIGYTKDGFDIEQHKKLFSLCNEISKSNKIMMSNSNVPLIKEYFDEENYNYNYILTKRAINSINPGAVAKEIILTNY